jgi:hypothetical protein
MFKIKSCVQGVLHLAFIYDVCVMYNEWRTQFELSTFISNNLSLKLLLIYISTMI